MNLLDTALQYWKSGLKVIPVTKQKRPACAEWGQYQIMQTETEVRDLFRGDHYGLAVLMGDGLECLDFDEKYDPERTTYTEFTDRVKLAEPRFNPDALLVQSTPSGGKHIVYRTDMAEGNQKLTKKGEYITIETRGEGGYICVYPTPGYSMVAGSFTRVPKITNEGRNTLINVARTMSDQEPEPVREKIAPEPTTGLSVADDYNQRMDGYGLAEVLEKHGWQIHHQSSTHIYLTRPGKDLKEGHSADIRHGHPPLFRNWSGNADGLSSSDPYSPFGVYAALEHGGDHSAAAKQLFREGFGELKKEEVDSILARVLATKADINTPPKEYDYVFKYHSPMRKKYDIAAPGMIVTLVGKQKSRKTTFLNAVAASGISGNMYLGFELDMRGKNMVWVDTEQPKKYYWRNYHRILKMAGLHNNSPMFSCFHLREFSKRDRTQAVAELCEHTPNLGAIFIDGSVDLCTDFNDITASDETVQFLMNLTERTGAILFNVIHTTKGQGYLRGHLGSFLEQKSDAVIEVERDDEIQESRIFPRDMREAPFPEQWFRQDEYGMPLISTGMSRNVREERETVKKFGHKV